MNNELHGLCKKCIENFQSDPPPSINYQCQKCNENEGQFIQNNCVICIKCYYKEKQSLSVFKKSFSSQVKQQSSGTIVPKGQMSTMTKFLNRSAKIVKKLQKLLSSYDLKTQQLTKQLQKKCILGYSHSSDSPNYSKPITWPKIVQKCNKTSCLFFIFISKDLIFGAFHSQPIKITSQPSTLQDPQSGLFLTQRTKYDLSLYKTNKNLVKYNPITKSISFGDPSAFQIIFLDKDVSIKSEFNNNKQLKCDNIIVYKG